MITTTCYRFLGKRPSLALVRGILERFDEVHIGSRRIHRGDSDATIEEASRQLLTDARGRRPVPAPAPVPVPGGSPVEATDVLDIIATLTKGLDA